MLNTNSNSQCDVLHISYILPGDYKCKHLQQNNSLKWVYVKHNLLKYYVNLIYLCEGNGKYVG